MGSNLTRESVPESTYPTLRPFGDQADEARLVLGTGASALTAMVVGSTMATNPGYSVLVIVLPLKASQLYRS